MSARLYPRDVDPDDEILIRESTRGGSFYTDAGTVARGKHGRRWIRVDSVTRGARPQIIGYVDGYPYNLAGAPNSKLITRKASPCES